MAKERLKTNIKPASSDASGNITLPRESKGQARDFAAKRGPNLGEEMGMKSAKEPISLASLFTLRRLCFTMLAGCGR